MKMYIEPRIMKFALSRPACHVAGSQGRIYIQKKLT